MEFFDTVFPFIVAFISAVILIPIVIQMASSQRLVERNDHRKSHGEKVSSLGGIPIYMALAIGLYFSLDSTASTPFWVLGLALPILIVGFLDDLFRLSIGFRLVVQILTGILVFELGFSPIAGEDWLVSMGATAFVVVLFINAYNFIDGINGLSGSLGLIASLFFGYLLAINGDVGMAALSFSFGGSLAGFLLFNFRKQAKIFMGDSGSTVLGLFMAVMMMAVTGPTEGAHSSVDQFSNWPLIVAIIGLPVFDLLKVTGLRTLKGDSPFTADRTHIHHLISDSFLSPVSTSWLLASWVLILGMMTLQFPTYFDWGNGLVFLAVPYFLAQLGRQKVRAELHKSGMVRQLVRKEKRRANV